MPRTSNSVSMRVRRNPPAMQKVVSYKLKPKYKRSGGYIKDFTSSAGSNIGRYVGSTLGSAVERFTGLGAYNRRRYYTGRGSYNEVASGALAPLPPVFAHSNNKDYVEVTHREYLGDLYSSSVAGALNIQSFYINPGDSVTFPWLCNIAGLSFQQYQFNSLIFEFKSFSSDALNSTNTALGCVVAAITYDSTDPIPVNRSQLENTDWSQSYKPSQSFAIPVECKTTQNFSRGFLNTRQSQFVAPGIDRKTLDLARLDIATLGMQGTSVNLGSLFATYSVRLYKATQFLPLLQAGACHYINSTGVTNATPFGTATTQVVVKNNLGVVLTNNSLTIPLQSIIPNALYQLRVYWQGGSATIAAPVVTGTGSFSNVADISTTGARPLNLSSVYIPPNLAVSTNMCLLYYIYANPNPVAPIVITLGAAGTLPTAPSVDIEIIQMNGDSYNNT